jgi:hypothetical protein
MRSNELKQHLGEVTLKGAIWVCSGIASEQGHLVRSWKSQGVAFVHPVRPACARNLVTVGACESRTQFLPCWWAGVVDAVTLHRKTVGACHWSRTGLVHLPCTPCEVALQNTRVCILHALWIRSLHHLQTVSIHCFKTWQCSLVTCCSCNGSRKHWHM